MISPSKFALKTQMDLEFLGLRRLQPFLGKPCNPSEFRISSALPEPVTMNANQAVLRPLLAGLVITLLQIIISVLIIAPPGSLSLRYESLIQHDSYWFANIIDRGYETPVPPVEYKMMEISNVAFFPAYPALSALLQSC